MRFLTVVFILFFCFSVAAQEGATKNIVSAFLRVKNEINTIEACLDSIDGIFDRIVIIHSNEPDDGSVAVMNKWCAKRSYCEIHEYPHAVIPSHDVRYRQKDIPAQNTLAAYYNFGLQFFEPDEWVAKIDGDQVYIRSQLKKTIDTVRYYGKNKVSYSFSGYNTFVYRNRLVKYAPAPVNGLRGDSFITQRKDMVAFKQSRFYEQLQRVPNMSFERLSGLNWFHYMKSLKKNGVVRSVDALESAERANLTEQERELYAREVAPLIPQDSAYARIAY